MPNTHCMPSGSLGTAQLNVPSFPGPSGSVLLPSGSKRGVVVLMHGMLTFAAAYPYVLQDVSGVLPELYQTLATNLQGDGWVVIWPTLVGDDYASVCQRDGILGDLTNDAGNGSRFGSSVWSLWWDHALGFISSNFPGCPIVPFGVSTGGLQAYLVAIHRTPTIAAYGAHIPNLLMWAVQRVGANFDVSPTTWSLASGMNGLTLPQSTVTCTTSTTGAPSSGCLVVVASPNNQIIRYTGTSGSTFTGCTGGDSTSTMATGGTVSQSTFSQGLDVSMTAFNALKPGSQGIVPAGFVGWETADTICGFANPQTLYNNGNGAGAPLTSFQGSGDHILDTAAVNAICNAAHNAGWFPATVDPLCPAVH
jgi:hypothetical protein